MTAEQLWASSRHVLVLTMRQDLAVRTEVSHTAQGHRYVAGTRHDRQQKAVAVNLVNYIKVATCCKEIRLGGIAG